MIDQAAPHDAGGNHQEVTAILPVYVLGRRQSQKSFVDQSRGLQRMPGTLAPKIAGGEKRHAGANDAKDE